MPKHVSIAAGALAGLAAAAGIAVPAATAAPQTVRVGSGFSGLSHATYLGPADPSEVRTVGVALSDPAAQQSAQAYYAQVYDPKSPNYHHFLTPTQYAATFHEPAATTSSALAFLKGGGLDVVNQSSAGDWFLAQGTVGQLDKLFSVSIGRYEAAGIRFEANNAAPAVPAGLPVSAVFGLDTYHKFQIPGGLRSHPAAKSAGTSASTNSGILTPQELWGNYDEPSTDLGDGQTMGIFGEGETASVVANLRLFEQHFNFPKVPVNVVHTEGGKPSDYGDNSGNIEWYLDSQASTGMSPNAAALDLYFAKSLYDQDILNDFAYWAEDVNGPLQMNASFGECETNPANPVFGPLAQVPFGTEFGDELEPVGDSFLLQAAIEGRTLFASTGDTGSGCPEVVVPVAGAGNGLAVQPVKEVNYPAASPYAVAVGGTVVSVNDPSSPTGTASRASESSWTFTGGGASYFIPRPHFQAGTANVNEPCVSQPNGTPYTTPTICRGIPDVATMSGNVTGNGYSIYIDGNFSSEGGTSLSSPLMVGMWNRIQAAAPHNPHSSVQGLGFADESLYPAAAHNNKAFYDVTTSEYGAGNGAYRPGPGWDYTSGLGAPDVTQLLKTLDGTTSVPAHPAAAPAALPVCTASLTSPAGNSTDPVTSDPLGSYSPSGSGLGYDAALDITGTTLTTQGKNVVATITGPAVSATSNPPTGTGGRGLYVLWSSQDPKTKQWNEWFLLAQYDSTNAVQVMSGESTAPNGPPYAYAPDTSSKATYKVSGDTITITAPLSEVGNPAPGTLFTNPYALAQDNVGAPGVNAIGGSPVYLGLAVDTAALPTAASLSQGVAVQVGATKGC